MLTRFRGASLASVAAALCLLACVVISVSARMPLPSSSPVDPSIDSVWVCPPLSIPDPSAPVAPPAFSFLSTPVIKPSYANASWYMIDVIHSLSESWMPGKVVCKYACCASYGCPTVALVSEEQFANPSKPDGAYWGPYSRINDTLICAPNDHDVQDCPFS